MRQINEKKHRKVIFVGLSGGVDSSVSAALLKEQGFDVRGVFIKVWQPDIALTGGCTWKEDRLDAMRVCTKLDIPFFTLDLEKKYKKEVVDYMIGEYEVGRTPNPDVMCNKYVKFGGFFDWAMKNGADYVATGHYAQVLKTKAGYQMLAGKDKNKDQSYFLWTLTQKQLAKTFFPVGDLNKVTVRKLAKKFDLKTSGKKDSQGLCFIGKVDMTDFLKKFIKTRPGNVLNENRKVIGTHQGAELYTIGQRHGFSILEKTPKEQRYFVMGKNLKENTLLVSHNQIDKIDIKNREIYLKNVNWILGKEPDFTKKYSARIRYRQPLEYCNLKRGLRNKVIVNFINSQKAPTAGQSVVIYDGEVCLGGGIIE